MSWFAKSLLGLFFIALGYVSVGFFQRTYQVRGEITLLWYGFGWVLMCLLTFPMLGITKSYQDLVPSWEVVALISLSGATAGFLGNVFAFASVTEALHAGVNGGVPVAIVGASGVLVFFFMYFLGRFLPEYFSSVMFGPQYFFGVLLIVGGILTIGFRSR